MAMTSANSLLTVLQAEYRVASQLLDILLNEREALRKSDVDTISEASKKKQPLTVQLEQLGRQREAILQSEGFSSGKDGLEAFIANQDESQQHAFKLVLEPLKKVAAACRENNQINGGIVNVNRQYLHRAMSVLRGRDMNITSYGPGGEYTSSVVRQPLLGRV
jgi:flagella synthesis protein FlgN